MFDLNLIRSYVSYLREEGVKSIHSSQPSLAKYANKLSLSTISFFYFTHTLNEPKKTWQRLFRHDIENQRHKIGVDIFRSRKVKFYKSKNIFLNKSLALIKNAWPEYYKVIKCIPFFISKTTSKDKFESASDPQKFSQILYRLDSKSVVKWAEIIVHEIAHHYLNIIITTHTEKNVLTLPWKKERFSAIRSESRPIIGVYHGLFAQACMLEFANQILKNKNISHQYKRGAKRILAKYIKTFLKDFNTIKEEHNVLNFDKHAKSIILNTRIKTTSTH